MPKPANFISNHWTSLFHIQKTSQSGLCPTPTLLGLSPCACQLVLVSAETWAMDVCCDPFTQGWDLWGGLIYPGGKLMLAFAFRDENPLCEHWLCFLPQPIPHHEIVPFIGSIHMTGWTAGRIYFLILSSHWGKGYLHVLIDISHVNPWFINGKKNAENC